MSLFSIFENENCSWQLVDMVQCRVIHFIEVILAQEVRGNDLLGGNFSAMPDRAHVGF